MFEGFLEICPCSRPWKHVGYFNKSLIVDEDILGAHITNFFKGTGVDFGLSQSIE